MYEWRASRSGSTYYLSLARGITLIFIGGEQHQPVELVDVINESMKMTLGDAATAADGRSAKNQSRLHFIFRCCIGGYLKGEPVLVVGH